MESGLSGCGEWRGSGSHISLVPVTQNFSENLYAIDRSSKTFWRGQRLRKFNKNSDCRFARFRKKNFWPPKPEIAIPVQIRISRVFAVLWSVERGADRRVDKSSFKARAISCGFVAEIQRLRRHCNCRSLLRDHVALESWFLTV